MLFKSDNYPIQIITFRSLLGGHMKDNSLLFELFTTFLIAGLGAALLISGLPGWGLIITAMVLLSVTIGLRTAKHYSTILIPDSQ